jgi:hypothetical protein
MSDVKTATATPVTHKEIESELLAVTISALSQDAFNFVFAYRNAAMTAVRGTTKLSTMREKFANDYFVNAITKEALILAKRLYVKEHNVGPEDAKQITDRQLWSFIAGL